MEMSEIMQCVCKECLILVLPTSGMTDFTDLFHLQHFHFKIIIVISFKIIMNLEEHMPQALLFTSERYIIPF